MKKLIIAAVVALTSFGASAECWVVGDIAGTAYFKGDGYKETPDAYSGKIMINIDGESASIASSGLVTGGMEYFSPSPRIVLGFSLDKSKPVFEVWSINEDKVTLAKSVSGWGGLDSTKAMVGNVLGKC